MRIACLSLLMLFGSFAFAGSSSITEADGESCMGDDKSKVQTERIALESAKRMAIEYSSTHISSTTVVENFQLKEDIVEAFNQAEVKILEILEEKWQDPNVGDCFTVRIKAEVVPSDRVMQSVDSSKMLSDPRLPLNVNLWVNSPDESYTEGENMKVYLQGNKPFYARLIYVDAEGNNVQILPNQHRSANYFAGSTIFEVPTGEDGFQLTVSPPFGQERLVLYASTSPLGAISTADAEDVYVVTEKPMEIAAKTRGIKIKKPTEASKQQAAEVAEFAEAEVNVTTQPAAPAQSDWVPDPVVDNLDP